MAEIKELARTYTMDAVKALVSIMKNEEAKDAARVAAASAILDRGYGKPGQHVEHSGSISLASLIAESLGLGQKDATEKDSERGEHPTVQ